MLYLVVSNNRSKFEHFFEVGDLVERLDGESDGWLRFTNGRMQQWVRPEDVFYIGKI